MYYIIDIFIYTMLQMLLGCFCFHAVVSTRANFINFVFLLYYSTYLYIYCSFGT